MLSYGAIYFYWPRSANETLRNKIVFGICGISFVLFGVAGAVAFVYRDFLFDWVERIARRAAGTANASGGRGNSYSKDILDVPVDVERHGRQRAVPKLPRKTRQKLKR